MSQEIKICITDDHALFRKGLANLLELAGDIVVLGEFGSGQELINYLHQNQMPDVLLLDLTMPDMDGFQILDIIHKNDWPIRTIVISMHDDGNYVVKAIKLGVQGYLYKNVDDAELIEAIRTVAGGDKYFNQEVSAKMASVMAFGATAPKELSRKEKEVLNLLSKGMITKEIAEKLYISTRTVESHRANMMKKLDVKNTAELISKAAKLDII